jgi:hypothetical protein
LKELLKKYMFWTKMDLEITLKQDRISLGNKLKKR